MDQRQHAIIESVIHPLAAMLATEYRYFVESEDIRQLCWLHCLDDEPGPQGGRSSQAQVLEWLELDDEGELVDPFGRHNLQRELRKVALRYCKQEKAYKSGTDVLDDKYYNRNEVRSLLVDFLHGEWEFGPGGSREPVTKTTENTSMNRACGVLDIGSAWPRISQAQRDVLIAVHLEGLDSDELGEMMGLAPKTAAMREVRAIDALIGKLGGHDPWR